CCFCSGCYRCSLFLRAGIGTTGARASGGDNCRALRAVVLVCASRLLRRAQSEPVTERGRIVHAPATRQHLDPPYAQAALAVHSVCCHRSFRTTGQCASVMAVETRDGTRGTRPAAARGEPASLG